LNGPVTRFLEYQSLDMVILYVLGETWAIVEGVDPICDPGLAVFGYDPHELVDLISVNDIVIMNDMHILQGNARIQVSGLRRVLHITGTGLDGTGLVVFVGDVRDFFGSDPDVSQGDHC